VRRFRVLAFAALVLCSVHQSAHAVGVFGSWWQMDENSADGFGFGLRHEINFTPLIGIEGRASWISFSGVLPVSDPNPPEDNGADVIPLEAMGVVSLGLFYGGVGVGYYMFDAETVSLSDEAGWFGLLGVELGLGPVKAFADVKWTQVETSVEDGSQTFDAGGVGVNVGVDFGI
jgi:Outer membrane protein beta-barrel domain